jgi:hypothetical protein
MSAIAAPPTHATIASAFLDTVTRRPDAVALRTLDDAISLT